jgi:hypothetical protein
MRATLAWILTLTSGFAALMALAIMVLLPIEAAKNRAVYRVVDQYAHTLAEAHALPRNPEVDRDVDATIKGIRMWPSLPGGCHDTAFEASSDRFDIGFWDNGSQDRFGASWWHCYAYPSGNTTLQVSVGDYLTGSPGRQIVAYFLIAVIAGYLARSLRRHNRRPLKDWTKALWFGAFMTIASAFSVLSDFGDDEFWKNPDWQKWFDLVFRSTVWPIFERPISIVEQQLVPDGRMLTLFAFGMWSTIGWAAGRLISLARRRMGTS